MQIFRIILICFILVSSADAEEIVLNQERNIVSNSFLSNALEADKALNILNHNNFSFDCPQDKYRGRGRLDLTPIKDSHGKTVKQDIIVHTNKVENYKDNAWSDPNGLLILGQFLINNLVRPVIETSPEFYKNDTQLAGKTVCATAPVIIEKEIDKDYCFVLTNSVNTKYNHYNIYYFAKYEQPNEQNTCEITPRKTL